LPRGPYTRRRGGVSPPDVLTEATIGPLKGLAHSLPKPTMPFPGWLRLVVGQRLVEVHRQHLGAKARDAGQEISLAHGAWPAASSVCLAARLAGGLPPPSEAAVRTEALALPAEGVHRMEPPRRRAAAPRHFE